MNTAGEVKVLYSNLVEMQEDACRKYAANPLYGTKKEGVFHWTTYGEFARLVDDFRGGLAWLGVGRNHKVAIISKNTLQWAVACYAAFGREAQFVPMYDTQLPRHWEYICRDSGARVLLVANPEIYRRIQPFAQTLENLEHIVLLEGAAGPQTVTWDALLQKGKETPAASREPDYEAEMGLLYTYGTTGKPKGVVLTHHNMLFTVASLRKAMSLDPEDRSLSFLPWAHCYGQLIEVHGLIQTGCSTGLVADVNELEKDMALVRPTVFWAVPRVYNRIYERINTRISEKPAVIRNLFRAGLERARREREGEAPGFQDRVILALARKMIFGKILNLFGGRLRLAFSGASALNPEVAQFIDDLGITVLEAYGLTENIAALTGNLPQARKFGSVGRPFPGIRIEIDRTVAGAGEGDGEVVAYGENIMKGYHNLPGETRKVLTENHGLRTGDLGHLDADGFLYITGRVKEQYKLENGKYVAPAPLEAELKLSPYISQVMIYGFNRPHNVALVVADLDALKRFARKKALTQRGSVLLNQPAVRQLFREQIDAHSTNFKAFELIRNFSLLAQEWTIDNGLLTPTLKLKRAVVEERFRRDIESLYA